MTVTWDGALFAGPETDGTAYYSCSMPNPGAGDFAVIIGPIKIKRAFGGAAPGVTNASFWGVAGTAGITGPGGNDSGFTYTPGNNGTPGNRKKLRLSLWSSAGQSLTSSGITYPFSLASTYDVNDAVLLVVQSISGSVTVKSCRIGSGAVTTEATGVRNASWTFFGGAWLIGNNPQQAQALALITGQGLTDAEIISWAAGTDPDTIVTTTANRKALWNFNSISATTIATQWGAATAAARTGTFTNGTVATSIVPNAAAQIAVTNEPVIYGAVALNDDGSNPTQTWTGTYVGTAPTAMQYRIEDTTGADVVAWTDLTSFSASAGTWSGTTAALPAGGLYRLHVRDKNSTAVVWRGANPWNVCPVSVSMGQSPYYVFEGGYPGSTAPTNAYLCDPQGTYGITELYKANGAVGAGMAEMLNAWSAQSGGLPFLHQKSAVVGTGSDQWAARSSTVWTQFLAGLDAHKAKRVLLTWLNGANENGFTSAQIKTNHGTIVSNLDADLVSTRATSYRYKMLPHQRDPTNGNGGNTRSAQREFAETHALFGSKILLGPWWPDMQTDTEQIGTARAGGASTITLAATATATSITSGTVLITGGTGSGQTRNISSYNTSTKVVTVTAAWTTVPDATSTYVVVGQGSPHPDPVGSLRFGPRLGYSMAYAWGKTSITGLGPVPATAKYPNGGDGSIIDVTFTHRHGANLRTPNGGTTATGVAGFSVTSGGVAQTVTSRVITGPDTVRLTLSAAPPNKNAMLVSYADGLPIPAANFADVGGAVGGLGDLLYDDYAITPTSGLPAFFTYNDAPLAVTEAPATALITTGFFALV